MTEHRCFKTTVHGARVEARAQLAALKGIGPWTVVTVAMRALGDPDAFLPTDLGVVQQAATLGLDKGLVTRAERWRPWRARNTSTRVRSSATTRR